MIKKEISSEKILEKLNQIKRTFMQNPSEPINHHLKTSDVRSQDNQKLKKYLPGSFGKISIENQDSPPINNNISQHYTAITFRNRLQQKLENLFNEQKNLLKMRFYDHQKSLQSYNSKKQFQLKNTNLTGYQNSQTHDRQDCKKLEAMEDKIKQLENKMKKAISIQYIQKQKQNPEQSLKKQIGDLRQALLQIQKLNNDLKGKLQKKKKKTRTNENQLKLQLQNYKVKETYYLNQIQQLKTQIALKKKNKQTQSKQNIKILSNKKNYDNSVVLELYNQIDQLKYKLNKETKEKLTLEQRNSWLENQLHLLLNAKNNIDP